MDRGMWGSRVHGVAKSHTLLKRLNMHTLLLGTHLCFQIHLSAFSQLSILLKRRKEKKKSESRLLYYFLLVTSLVAQLVKNPSEMRKTWIRSLGWEDPLEKGKATHFNILAWRILVSQSWTQLSDFQERK